MLQRRYPTLSNNDVSSSDEDEGDRFVRDDEEQERELSRRNGEASEASPGIKKQQTDAEIANTLNANDVTKRKRRQVLTEAGLTGSKGLIKIRRNFPSKLRYRPPNFNTGGLKRNVVSKRKRMEQEIQAAATYTSNLMQNYEEFATELVPTEHFTDTLNKIQDLGSKKQVKAYLDIMREEVCKQHIEGIHGKEKTEKLFNELEHGLQTHKKRLLDEAESEIDAQLSDDGSLLKNNSIDEKKGVKDSGESINSKERGTIIKNKDKILPKSRQETDDSSEEEEIEASFDDVAGSAAPERAMDTENSGEVKGTYVSIPIKDASIMGENSNDYASGIITTDKSKEINLEQNCMEEVISQEILVMDGTQNSTSNSCEGRNGEGSKEEGGNKAPILHTVAIGPIDDFKNDKNNSQGILNTQISGITQFSQADSESQERLTFDASQSIAETQTLVGTQNENTHTITSVDNNNTTNYSRKEEEKRDIDQELEALQGKSHNAKTCQNSTIVELSQIESGMEEGPAFDSSQNAHEANTTILTPNATNLFSQDY